MRSYIRFSTLLVVITLVLVTGVALNLGVLGVHRFPERPAEGPDRSSAERGREAITRYGCGACHVIPGIRHATGRVGPRLVDLVNQSYLAGVLPNTEENLARWIRDPQEINPPTAMPDLEVNEEEAQDIAAYLYSSRAQWD